MHYQLKDHYGRRITPGVKVFILVAIVIFGLYLAFGGTGHDDKKAYVKKVMVEQTVSLTTSAT